MDNLIKKYLKQSEKDKANLQDLFTFRYKAIKGIKKYYNKFTKIKTPIATISISSNSKKSIYCFLYFDTDITKIEYICLSPTYTSCDGEFRRRLMPYEQFVNMQKRYVKILEVVEKMVIDIFVDSHNYTFEVNTFSPINTNLEAIQQLVSQNRLEIITLVFNILINYNPYIRNVRENHTNPDYTELLFNADLSKKYKEVLNKENQVEIWCFEKTSNIFDLFLHLDPKRYEKKIQVGQKLIPITLQALGDENNIEHDVWRELYINNLVYDLVANEICLGIPFAGEWFYVSNINDKAFDNRNMYLKLEKSELASTVNKVLADADNQIQPMIQDQDFFALSKKIDKALIFSESKIELAKYGVCVLIEYMEKTLRDYPRFANESRKELVNVNQMFTGPYFVKNLFEWIYTLYCMNTRLMVMHGDLHLNNVTLYKNYEYFTRTGTTLSENIPQILFRINDKLSYLFDDYGIGSVIIDMSRSVYMNFDSIEKQFGPIIARKTKQRQIKRMIQSVKRYLPSFYKKYENRLNHFFESKPILGFKIITLLDPFSISKNALQMFELDSLIQTVDALNLKYLKMVKSYCEQEVVELLKNAMDNKIHDIEYPLINVIKLFKEYLFTEIPEGKFVMTYMDAKKPLNIRMNDPDTYPKEWRSYSKIDESYMEAEINEYKDENSNRKKIHITSSPLIISDI